jgi:hypothetical protein
VSPATARTLTPSEREWLAVRSYLGEHRHELAEAAAEDYPPGRRVAGTPLLAAPGWLPAAPVPLRDISLELDDASPDGASPDGASPDGASPDDASPDGASPDDASPDGAGRAAEFDVATPLLPWRADGTRYARYSEAMAELAAPLVFENRVTYRLAEAELSGSPRLAFTAGRYFDGIDVGEAAAHEYAAARLGVPAPGVGPAGLRGRFADPCDLRRRPANLAIAVLTLRLDRRTARASFLLHWRDPAKVGHAGGLYQVIPVGIFQPSGEAAWNRRNDFSVWRCMIREFAEELGGRSEEYGSESAPVDYESWPFARQLAGALDRGQVRVWCLGLGTDPLTYATDLLTVAVIDSDVFDALFGVDLQRNAEGAILAAREFAAHVIDAAVSGDPVQAAGAALLRLAWQHRETLTG